MSEDLKTIKEIADEIGVSKQAVWQKIKKESSIDLRQFTSKKGNTVYVDVDGQKAIKSAFFNKTSKTKRQTEKNHGTPLPALVAFANSLCASSSAYLR